MGGRDSRDNRDGRCETARAGMSHAPSPSASICVICGFILPFCASCASLWLIFFICASAVSFSHFLGVLAVQPHPCPSVFYPPMSRPLRAGFEGVFCTQGVALECLPAMAGVCRAPSGLPSAPICVHLRFISPITLCLLCLFVANSSAPPCLRVSV